MSNNESTVSETTPLRRNNISEINEDVRRSESTSTSHNVNNILKPNSNCTNITPSTSATTIVFANPNQNNNIEVRLASNKNIANNYNLSSINNNLNREITMDTNKRILCRIGLDVLILICVGFPILCFHLWGVGYKRGFFCDDETLMHPFKESTVKSWMLYIIGLVIPVGVMLSVEIIKSKQNARRSNGNTTTTARRYVFMDYEIPNWLVECYKKVGVFGFGAAVSQLTTDIAKYSIGRLRPHFFSVCQPVMKDGTTCADPINAGKYIQDFSCYSVTSTARMLKEVRLSFPSGHSSFTFYTMVYTALYMQSRMSWRGSKLLRHFLQFLFIMTAWYTALSRVSDYKHHWSDVLAGSIIGSLTAVIVAKYVSDLFEMKSAKCYLLPRTSQDVPQTITTNGH